eukprot:3104000-Amphidinium_carterae.1
MSLKVVRQVQQIIHTKQELFICGDGGLMCDSHPPPASFYRGAGNGEGGGASICQRLLPLPLRRLSG